MVAKSPGARRCRESLEFTVSVTSHKDVAVTHSCCTNHVAQKSQASWREISVWERNAKRSSHHLRCAVCTLIWSSGCVSHIHPSTALYGYSHNFKICSSRRVALGLSPFEMDVFCTLFMMGGEICDFPPVSSGKYVFSFSHVCTKSQPAEVSSPIGAEGQSCPVGCLLPEPICQFCTRSAPSVCSVAAEREF